MAKKKFTKGNWRSKGLVLFGKDNKVLAQFSMQNFKHDVRGRQIPDLEGDYNAQLAALAPQMYESLKEFVRMYEEVEPAGGYQGVYDTGRYLLAEATKEII